MREMLPIIMDTDFNRLCVVDDYKSFIWTARYYLPGDFELCIDVRSNAKQYIQKDYYITRDNDDHVGIIDNIKIEKNEDGEEIMVISGKFLSSIIGRRIIATQIQVSGTIPACIQALLNANAISPSDATRQIPNLSFSSSVTLATQMQQQFTGKNLLDSISEICETYGVGFDVLLNSSNQFVFTLYEGTDRSYDQIDNPYVIFSDLYDNLLSSEYEENYQGLATAVLVAGEGEGLERKTIWALGGYQSSGGNLLTASNIVNYNLLNYSYSNGVYTGTAAGPYHGIRICAPNFMTVGETYMIKYKFRKTNGTLKNIAGVCSAFTQLECTIDGTAISSYSRGTTLTDDTTIHEVVFIGTYNKNSSDNNFYIQPNRTLSDTVTFEVWDIQVLTVYENSGLHRYETYVDARNASTNNGEISDDVYYKQLQDEGVENLTTFTQAFSGAVDMGNYNYPADINVGDLCVIQNTKWGIFINSRIIEVIESMSEAGEYSIIPTFGV